MGSALNSSKLPILLAFVCAGSGLIEVPANKAHTEALMV